MFLCSLLLHTKKKTLTFRKPRDVDILLGNPFDFQGRHYGHGEHESYDGAITRRVDPMDVGNPSALIHCLEDFVVCEI